VADGASEDSWLSLVTRNHPTASESAMARRIAHRVIRADFGLALAGSRSGPSQTQYRCPHLWQR